MSGINCKLIDPDDSENGFIPIGKVSEFENRRGKCFQIGTIKIAVFRDGDRFGAVGHECIHMGGPLADGDLKDDYIICPFHGWTYDFQTGMGSHRFKGEDVPSYPIKVVNGEVFLSLEEKGTEEKILEEQDKERWYLEEWARGWDEFEDSLYAIQHLLIDEKSEISAMGSLKKHPDWDTILFKGGQLHRMPLNDDEEISMRTVIGPSAKKPLEISIPFYVSHMSFGALSKEAKIALAKGSTLVDTAMCSGEGGMLPESRKESRKYIYELGTAMFSHRDESI
jgi:nitrite reductase/ring-hydroxylating ferredoxin subunit